VSEPLPAKTPVMMKPIRSVLIKFMDGTTREIILTADTDEGFYKSESIGKLLQDHTVYVVNGSVRDSPAFGLD
jgi:hypothetical protein